MSSLRIPASYCHYGFALLHVICSKDHSESTLCGAWLLIFPVGYLLRLSQIAPARVNNNLFLFEYCIFIATLIWAGVAVGQWVSQWISLSQSMSLSVSPPTSTMLMPCSLLSVSYSNIVLFFQLAYVSCRHNVKPWGCASVQITYIGFRVLCAIPWDSNLLQVISVAEAFIDLSSDSIGFSHLILALLLCIKRDFELTIATVNFFCCCCCCFGIRKVKLLFLLRECCALPDVSILQLHCFFFLFLPNSSRCPTSVLFLLWCYTLCVLPPHWELLMGHPSQCAKTYFK